MFFLIIICFFFQPKTEIQKKTAQIISLINKKVIKNDHFYKRLMCSVSEDGEVLVFNEGEGVISLFNKNLEKLIEFGRFGEGPGEFSSTPFSINTYIVNKNIIILNSYKSVQLFDFNGKLLKEIKVSHFFPFKAYFSSDQILLYDNLKHRLKYSQLIFTKNFKLIKKERNKISSQELRSRYIIKNNEFYVYKGDYKVNQYNRVNGILTKSYTKFFKRLAKDENLQVYYRKKLSKIKDKNVRKDMAQLLGVKDNFEDDIVNILGHINNYLFIRTQTKDALRIDIIDFKNKCFKSSISLKGDSVESAKVEHGKLLLNRKNDEDGLYVEIYDIKIN